MADVLSAPSLLSEASDSELEVSSLCGSELELEMAWGVGPIAPLRTEAPADQGVANERSNSRGNGSARARTPQKRGSESPLARSKRLINIHPIRSVPYLPTPNELPVGVRKQQRWFNDHHFGNRAASTRLEDLMEHMQINVEWRSNFQKLAEPQNQELQTAFRKGRVPVAEQPSNQPRPRRRDDWALAETMFMRVERRARTLMLRSFSSFAPFIEAVEYMTLHFVQWREAPSELEVAAPLFRILTHPVELMKVSEKEVRLVLPLADSAFHRLIIHSVCQFYGVRSRTEPNRRFNTKIMVLKSPKRKFSEEEMAKISLCEFIRETRVMKAPEAPLDASAAAPAQHALLEHQSKSSECSEGFCLVDAPQM